MKPSTNMPKSFIVHGEYA